jgi:hypothetical protein
LNDPVLGVTQVAKYFNYDCFDDNVPGALVVLAMIKKTIEEALD